MIGLMHLKSGTNMGKYCSKYGIRCRGTVKEIEAFESEIENTLENAEKASTELVNDYMLPFEVVDELVRNTVKKHVNVVAYIQTDAVDDHEEEEF